MKVFEYWARNGGVGTLQVKNAVLAARVRELEAEVGELKTKITGLEARLEAQVRRVKDAWRQIGQSVGYVLRG